MNRKSFFTSIAGLLATPLLPLASLAIEDKTIYDGKKVDTRFLDDEYGQWGKSYQHDWSNASIGFMYYDEAGKTAGVSERKMTEEEKNYLYPNR